MEVVGSGDWEWRSGWNDRWRRLTGAVGRMPLGGIPPISVFFFVNPIYRAEITNPD